DEAVLRETVTGRGSADAALGELDALAARAAGSEAAGLAQLSAGLMLIDAGRPAEAMARLRHPDLARTALRDYASFALGRAVEAARHDESAAAAAYDRLDQEYPDSQQAIEAAPRLRALAAYLRPTTPAAQVERDLQKALAFFENDRYAEAALRFRALVKRPL